MRYKKNPQKKPLCLLSKGCHLADVAGSRVLREKCMAFIQAENLAESPGYSEMVKKAVEESGLIDESINTIIQMKMVRMEYLKHLAEQEKNKATVANYHRTKGGR